MTSIHMGAFLILKLEKFLTIIDDLTKVLLENLKPIISNPVIHNKKNQEIVV